MTQGSQLTLYATRRRRHPSNQTEVAWLLDEIGRAGIQGATVTELREGIDPFGRYHSARFFELADQAVAITAIAANGPIDALLAQLKSSGAKLFFVRCPVEFELLGEAQGASFDDSDID